MKRSSIIWSMILLSLFCVLMALQIFRNTDESGKRKGGGGLPSHSKAASGYDRGLGSKQPVELPGGKFRSRSSDENPDEGKLGSGKAYHQLQSIFKESEASRARIMEEQHLEGALAIYLDVHAPIPEESKAMRIAMAEILKRVENSQRKEMEEHTTSLIDRYDPFRATGRRIVGIRIPDDLEEPMSGWLYPTPNPENEIQEFAGVVQVPAGMRFYVSSYNDSLDSFKLPLDLSDGFEHPYDGDGVGFPDN